MATIRERKGKKGTSYLAWVRLKGFPPQSASFKRKTDAQIWAQQTEAAIREGRYFKKSEGRKRTLEDLIERYKRDQLPKRGRDKETVGPNLDWWNGYLGKYYLSDITPIVIADYRDKLLNEPTGKNKDRYLANATVVRYIASLSVCFTYAVRDLGWLDSNPVKEVTKPKPARGRLRFLSDKERELLLKTCEESDSGSLYPVVILALSTGARLSEITGLRWKDIDLKKNILRFENTKNGDRRSVPLVGKALELVKGLKKVQRIDTDLLFPSRNINTPVDLRKTFSRAVERAGIEDFRFHDLRHTAASYLAMNGATLTELSHILGHKTLAMVKRYAHLTEEHTRGVLERMNEEQFSFEEVNNG